MYNSFLCVVLKVEKKIIFGSNVSEVLVTLDFTVSLLLLKYNFSVLFTTLLDVSVVSMINRKSSF